MTARKLLLLASLVALRPMQATAGDWGRAHRRGQVEPRAGGGGPG